jgi:hypothetical protein
MDTIGTTNLAASPSGGGFRAPGHRGGHGAGHWRLRRARAPLRLRRRLVDHGGADRRSDAGHDPSPGPPRWASGGSGAFMGLRVWCPRADFHRIDPRRVMAT